MERIILVGLLIIIVCGVAFGGEGKAYRPEENKIEFWQRLSAMNQAISEEADIARKVDLLHQKGMVFERLIDPEVTSRIPEFRKLKSAAILGQPDELVTESVIDVIMGAGE